MLQRDEPYAGDPSGLRLSVDPSPEAPGFARHAVQQWLTTLGKPRQLLEDAALVIGELVTNAVVHAESASLVVAELHGNRLRLEVHDESPRLPAPRTPDADRDRGGFGLQLVARVADDWGWSRTSTGKYVWTELG